MLKSISNISINASLLMVIAISTMTMAQSPAVVDVDGQPLKGGVQYYVLPAATDTAGGLTLANRTGSCPLYVGQERLSTVASQGLPVSFTPLSISGSSVIREGSDLRVAFSGVSVCGGKYTGWKIGEEDKKTSRRLIVTAQEQEQDSFRIDNDGGLYILGWCPSCNQHNCGRPRCGSAGVLIRNGLRLLALDAPTAFPFRFRRA